MREILGWGGGPALLSSTSLLFPLPLIPDFPVYLSPVDPSVTQAWEGGEATNRFDVSVQARPEQVVPVV